MDRLPEAYAELRELSHYRDSLQEVSDPLDLGAPTSGATVAVTLTVCLRLQLGQGLRLVLASCLWMLLMGALLSKRKALFKLLFHRRRCGQSLV